MRSIGTPELVTSTLADYESVALTLLQDPDALPALRGRIEAARAHSPLFDTRRFTRHFESALHQMAQRSRDGLPAEHFRVQSLSEG